MRIVFMGTPDFALAGLDALHNSRHEIVLVATQPDRPKGRGLKDMPPPVKARALELGLPVVQPDSLRSPEFHEIIRSQKADLLVVVAYRILPESLFALTTHGAVNLHGSLLPRYRGAAPVQWAIARGERETGLTVFQLDKQVDHGRVLAQVRTPIGPDETAGELMNRLKALGAPLLVETVDRLERGDVAPAEQSHEEATSAPKLKKEDGLIDWNGSARDIHNRVRAFNPYPICFSPMSGAKQGALRIHRTRIDTEFPNPGPGRITLGPGGIPCVGTADYCLALLEVQPEGKPAVAGDAWARGVRDFADLRLG